MARLEQEVRRLRQELDRERFAARQLRTALELSAAYFHSPLNDPGDEAVWQQISEAIRSEAGRSRGPDR